MTISSNRDTLLPGESSTRNNILHEEAHVWKLLIPNGFTLYRLCVGIYLPNLYLSHEWRMGLLVIGVSACFSDLLDGWSARKLNAESEFGKWLDPLADMTFCIGGVSVVLIDVGICWYALIYWVPLAWTAFYTIQVCAMRCQTFISKSNWPAKIAIASMMVSGCLFYARIAFQPSSDTIELAAVLCLAIGCVFEIFAYREYRAEADQPI